jgi:hypothetical protein
VSEERTSGGPVDEALADMAAVDAPELLIGPAELPAEPATGAGSGAPAAPASPDEPGSTHDSVAGGRPHPQHPTPAPVAPRTRTEAAPAGPSPEATQLLHGAVTFGRVDADGTVYIRSGEGDRAVGQFPDTAPNEALIYYVRKFEELVGQVDLFAQRLRAGSMSPKDARSGLGKLREAAAEPAAVGDVDGLQQWVQRLDREVDRRAREADARRASAVAKARTEREALVAEAERVAATPPDQMHFKSAMERLRALVEEWKVQQKAGPRLDKATEDALWHRLSAARSSVDRARRQHINTIAEQRASTRHAKERIISEAEDLATSTDWRATSEAFRTLMDRWKAAGRLARAEDDALWARFRAAQEQFHAARAAVTAAQDEQYRGNLVVKQQLLVEAEALLPVGDLDTAKRRLRDIQDRWDAAGRVPRADMERVERRLAAVADAIRQADQSRWSRTNPEALARARDVVSQLESSVATLRRDLEAAESADDQRGAERARTALDTRTAWLEQARKALADLGG